MTFEPGQAARKSDNQIDENVRIEHLRPNPLRTRYGLFS